MNENEEIMETEIAAEQEAAPSCEEELEETVKFLTAENRRLSDELFCLREGIPDRLAEDILGMARTRSEKGDISFEEAARDIFARISGFGAASQAISTGVRTENARGGDDLLRKAFGLK